MLAHLAGFVGIDGQCGDEVDVDLVGVGLQQVASLLGVFRLPEIKDELLLSGMWFTNHLVLQEVEPGKKGPSVASSRVDRCAKVRSDESATSSQ